MRTSYPNLRFSELLAPDYNVLGQFVRGLTGELSYTKLVAIKDVGV